MKDVSCQIYLWHLRCYLQMLFTVTIRCVLFTLAYFEAVLRAFYRGQRTNFLILYLTILHYIKNKHYCSKVRSVWKINKARQRHFKYNKIKYEEERYEKIRYPGTNQLILKLIHKNVRYALIKNNQYLCNWKS